MAEALAHIIDHPLDGGAIGDVAGECRGVELIAGGQFPSDTLRLVAALVVHDGDMHPLLGQRVADALPEPAIAARHQGNRAVEVHQLSPACLGQFVTASRSKQAIDPRASTGAKERVCRIERWTY